MAAYEEAQSLSSESSAARAKKQQRWWLQCGVGCGVLLLAGLVTFLILFFTLRKRSRGFSYGALQLLEKPKADPRAYQHAVLKNGLQVLNVYDPKSHFASFALAVEAGSYDDPPDLPGLAHFCEHMLFLGTERFPDPAGYRSFMALHGGRHNAFTSGELTVYFGEVAQEAVAEALDRFGDFFRAPLFKPEYVQKEVHAIDSEHAKNVQNPSRRVLETINALADPASPSSRFHTGSLETLYEGPRRRNVSAVDELRRWFRGHYCAPRMHLVTFGPAELGEQLDLARHTFDTLPQAGGECRRGPRTGPPPFPRERMGKWVVVQGAAAQQEAELWLHFALPDLRPHYRSQPLEYLTYLVSYGGERSLRRVLSDSLGLASSLKVMADENGVGTNFYMLFRLTPLGHEHPHMVMHTVFAYLAMARRVGVDQQLYSTLADALRLQWDWAQPSGPSDTVQSFAERMPKVPREHLLFATRIDAQNASVVLSLLEMLRPDNMNAILVSPTAEQNSTFREQARELPHYGVRYLARNLTEALGVGPLAQWDSWLTGSADAAALNTALGGAVAQAGVLAAAPPFMMVPGPIDGVPRSLALEHLHAARASPSEGIVASMYGQRPKPLEAAIGTRAGLRRQDVEVWYRDGWVTTSPDVRLVVSLRPLRVDGEPESSVHDLLRVKMYSRLFMEELAPKIYDVTMTGASCDVDVSTQGVTLSFGGFAPVLPKLAERVIDVFKRFNVPGNVTGLELERFRRIRQKLDSELHSYSSMPASYALQDLVMLLVQGVASNDDQLAALESVTPELAKAAAADLLFSRRLHTTALVMGNLDQEGAVEAIETCVSGLVSGMGGMGTAGSEGKVQHTPPVVSVNQPIELRRLNPRKGDQNHAVIVSLVMGVATVESRVRASLLAHILEPLVFTELRSNRQLGYVVQAGVSQLANVLALNTIVQSSVADADELEAAAESVLTGLMPERLFNLTVLDLLNYRMAFKQTLLQPPSSYGAEADYFWGPITKGGVCFGLRDEMLKYSDGPHITRETLMEEWARIGDPSLGARTKVVVKLFAGAVPPRPDSQAAARLWERHGVPAAARPLLERERAGAVELERADTATRQRLAEANGHYPQELYCEKGAGPTAPPPPGLPSSSSASAALAAAGPPSPAASHSLRRRPSSAGLPGALAPQG